MVEEKRRDDSAMTERIRNSPSEYNALPPNPTKERKKLNFTIRPERTFSDYSPSIPNDSVQQRNDGPQEQEERRLHQQPSGFGDEVWKGYVNL